ncbi:MAG: type II toxin-antitoxin system RelE/ParE family toxin [Saprospiraceae bacterium]|nr:MAG: type II toxin-antitoxin system RelE/ParE family toxin [Saprospiraceae bacterium]
MPNLPRSMVYSYQLLPEARTDLNEAVGWYAEKNVSAAQSFLDDYTKAIARITENPFQFPTAKGEVRQARLSRTFPYSIYFAIRGDVALAIAVFHDKRNPKIWQSRT